MFTDMVGYTALGQRNEYLSLALVEEQRKLIRPILARHRGREVKTIGDAIMVEFPNAVDAVRCAYDIQRALKEFNLSMEPGNRIHLRVGVHLGEVVESNGDISGDAVNVASRIEPLAEAGGVCITRQVYDHVKGKVDISLSSLGPKSLKNVAEPIEVYKMVLPWNEEIVPTPARLDKKRIAVLPFANMSPDPNDSYFADGMTEEIISTVSGISGLSVISRTSVMGYKGTAKKVEDIGRELKVGSILEGSFRKAGNKIRITTQLIDVETDRHLWAQNYDRELDDVFEVQSDIARQVAENLRVKILSPELERIGRKPTTDAQAYSLYLKGRYHSYERTAEGLSTAIAYFQEAIDRFPGYARAYAGVAECYAVMENWGYIDPSRSIPKVEENVSKALELDETLSEAHAMLGALLASRWDWAGAEREFEKAIELNPNSSPARLYYAYAVCAPLGRLDKGIAHLEKAEALDPLSPTIPVNIGDEMLQAGRIADAIAKYREVTQSNPGFVTAHSGLGIALALSGRPEEAIREGQEAMRLSSRPGFISDLIFVLSLVGRIGDARALFKELEKIPEEKRGAADFAVAHAALGETDEALDCLKKLAAAHSSQLYGNIKAPYFYSLRNDPRFSELLKMIGLA
jgi:TolB-like protein/Flp pilus assembly protein TadD